MREISLHIIHCTDTPDERHVSVRDIDGWHRERGWSGIGYHFVIYRDGTTHVGRPIEQNGAHVLGHNENSIGTALVGRSDFTEGQMKALRALHSELEEQFPGITYKSHNHFNPAKTCPNFDVDAVLGDVEPEAGGGLLENEGTDPMNNYETKPWYASKGVWGGLIAFVAGIAQIFGYTIAEADQAQLSELVMGIIMSGSGLLAWFGRVRAGMRIGS